MLRSLGKVGCRLKCRNIMKIVNNPVANISLISRSSLNGRSLKPTSIPVFSNPSRFLNVSLDPSPTPFRVAVVLSGSGVYDGAEVTEAVSALIHLSAHGCATQCYAPDINQHHVINHITGEVDESASPRNVLVESARIARGEVKPLSTLTSDKYDAVLFPGGFGAAKNLSDFAMKGAEMSVLPDVERVLKDFHANEKPIGLMCISPTLAAKVFGNNVKLTVGGDAEEDGKWPFAGAAEAIKAVGADHVVMDHEDVCIDKENKIATIAAYMHGHSNPSQVFDNIGNLIDVLTRKMKDSS